MFILCVAALPFLILAQIVMLILYFCGIVTLLVALIPAMIEGGLIALFIIIFIFGFLFSGNPFR